MKGRLIFLCALLFVGASACGNLFSVPVAVCAVCFVIFFLSAFFFRRAQLPAALAIVSLGLLGGSLWAELNDVSSAVAGRRVKIEAVVEDVGHTKKGRQRLEVSVGREGMYLYIMNGRIEGVRSGDIVRFVARPQFPENFTPDFDYVSYLASQGILTTAFVDASAVEVERRRSVPVRCRLKRLKCSVSERFDQILGEGEASAVIKALAIGDKQDIDDALRESYRSSGALHLLALSGLHVGVIYLILSRLLFFFGNSPAARRTRSGVIVAAMLFYAALTGLSPSICRAVLMIAVYEISELLTGGRNSLSAVSVAAILITAANPAAPLRTGFQLSFCAVLSIIFIYPCVNSLMRTRNRPLNYVWGLLSVSLACQVGTFPVSYLTFGTFPRFFMVTNLMAIPLVNAVMYLVAPLLVFGDCGVIGHWLTKIVTFMVEILNFLIELIPKM